MKRQPRAKRSQTVARRNKTDVVTSQAAAMTRSEHGCNKVYSGSGLGMGSGRMGVIR